MTASLKFDLNAVKTVVNPIFGLPTPHQRSVNRIIARLSDIEKARDYYLGFEPVTCRECSGTGSIAGRESCFCHICNGYGTIYELGQSK